MAKAKEARSSVKASALVAGGPGLAKLPAGIPASRSVRDRMDRYNARRDQLTPDLLRRVREQRLGTLGRFAVWTVDAPTMRGPGGDVDFCEGGNPGRYRYVPLDELWIESDLVPPDAAPTLLHEAVECPLMVRHGWTYNRAHDAANLHERAMRAGVAAGSVVVPALADVVPVVISWLQEHQPDLLGEDA